MVSHNSEITIDKVSIFIIIRFRLFYPIFIFYVIFNEYKKHLKYIEKYIWDKVSYFINRIYQILDNWYSEFVN